VNYDKAMQKVQSMTHLTLLFNEDIINKNAQIPFSSWLPDAVAGTAPPNMRRNIMVSFVP
jgi:NADH:ubiquinone oxidoreductase subunit 5 (subunit L)/multisubunit Na+/H+ antiporter MnhA subunit